jgi:hypothetical protein
MKRYRLLFIALMVVAFTAGIGCVSVQAQDMSIWIGKWFKVRNSNTENCLNAIQEIVKDSYTFTSYLKIWSWDSVNGILYGDDYSYDSDSQSWNIVSFQFTYLGGTNLDFLFSSQGTIAGPENALYALVGRITGKTKAGNLKSAALTVPGINSVGTHCTNWGKNTGSLITESKVPVPPGIIIH